MLIGSLHDVIHWPTQGGYNFVSGPLADITLVTAFLGTLYIFLRKHRSRTAGGWPGIPTPTTVIRSARSTIRTVAACP